MVCIRYVVYVYNMALNINIWVVLLIFGLKSDLVHGVGNTCDFPDVPLNSELTQRLDRGHVYQEGDVVKYQCKEGYSISGNIARSCTDGHWTNVRFTCDEITCGYAEPPDNGRIKNGVTYEIGSFVTFECNDGFKLKGNRRYICGVDGKWRYTSATKCEPIMCPSLNGIQYGSIFQDSSDGLRDNYMSVAEYTCIRGYKIFGKELQHTRTCQSDGQWSGQEPYCEAPVCDEIIPFYGGRTIFKNDNRREHALAVLRCDNGYSLYPTGINVIKCKTTWSGELEWTPEPPLCYKKLKVKVPNHCHTRSSNVELTHKQSFTLTPSTDYEFYETNHYLTSSFLKIINNNGTFEPPLPQCVPERCDARSLQNRKNMHVYYPNNNTRATGQVDSHTNYNLGCMDNYEFDGHDYRNNEYVVRRCEFGHFKNVPPCIAKRCYLTNNQLDLSRGRISSLELVEHSIRVDVNCKSGRHELYNNASQVYVNPFSTPCVYGQFDREVNSLNCVPKRCDAWSLQNRNNMHVYYPNNTRATGQADSHTNYNLGCMDNYEFDGQDYRNNEYVVRRCEFGQFVDVPPCIEKRCYLTNNQLDLSQGRRSSLELVEHNSHVDVNCKSDRHELYRNASQAYVNPFSTRCEYGQFNREVNLLNCVPKRCNTKNLLNMNVYQLNGASVSRMVDSHHKYKLACTDKYEFKGESYLDTPSIERTCENGDFVNVPKCVEKRCSLINTNIRLTLQNSQRPLHQVAHGRQVDVRCKLNRLQLFNPTSRKYLTDFSTECQFGHFDKEVNSLACVPKPCDTKLLAHTKVFNVDEKIEGLLEGDITYKLICETEQYIFEDYPDVGYINSRCEDGHFQNLSNCIEKPCKLLNTDKKLQFRFNTHADTIADEHIVKHNAEIFVSCKSDYELYYNRTSIMLGVNETTITCNYGNMGEIPNCAEKRCQIRITSDGDCYNRHQNADTCINSRKSINVRSGKTIYLQCKANYTLEPINAKANDRTDVFVGINCTKGKISPQYRCKPDFCEKPNEGNGQFKLFDSQTIIKDRLIQHGAQLQLECFDGYNVVDSNNEIVNNTSPSIQCDRGILLDSYQCKRCRNGQGSDNSSAETNELNTTTSGHHPENRTCDEYVDNVNTQETPQAGVGKDCTISESPEISKYTYIDDEGKEIEPPYSVMDGRQITVECKYDSYIYDYYGVTPNGNISCVNGIFNNVSIDCPDSPDPAVQSDSCQKFKVNNGKVNRNAMGKYYVLCDQGYTLNIPKVAHEKPCNCSEGELVCFAGTKPVCKADDCKIPFDIDRRLSVYEMKSSSRVDLTEGDKISDQSYVFFNCSNVIDHIYEPVNRRFQCVRGKWIAAHIRGSVWTLNNKGTFPQCREVKCDPPCKNGGVCYRDGECICKHMTTGDVCETLLCDNSCAKNGGECVKPGICGNCPISRHGDNCEREMTCALPSNAATYENHRTVFQVGETINADKMTCTRKKMLSPVESMTCQDNGTWTDIIACVRKTNFKYIVRIQVADKWTAGTDDNVYVHIYGHEGHTATFRMNGVFDRNKLVENEFRGIDVRPIRSVVVSKDKDIIQDALSILYASIFIDVDDDYYVFTYRDQPDVWLYASQPLNLSISYHPERCIHTYGEAMYRSPYDKYRGSYIGLMSLRECKQRCVTTRSLSCKSIYFMPRMQDNSGFAHCYHITHSPDSNYFRDNTSEQKSRRYVSYK